jgi:tRNA modification GTPase
MRAPGELAPDRRARFATFVDPHGAALDHGYVIAFPAAASFTGEPVVELWAHGSPPILDAIVASATAAGATLAGPGEFTYRALRHGKLDLARAEAIRDLVAARTLTQARLAFAQVEGALSRRVGALRDALIDLVARGEASVEFIDDAETELESGRFAAGIATALAEIEQLTADAARGRLFRDGARVTLSGRTSVGKSSLFNRLLGVDRAIVSPTAGTTRDTLEENLELDGLPVVLVDTAGMRPVDDAVEAEGVRRAREAAGEADVLVMVIDASCELAEEEHRTLAASAPGPERPMIVVANKADLAEAERIERVWPGALPVSARTGEGVAALRAEIRRRLVGAAETERPIVTQARHRAALAATAHELRRAREAVPDGVELALEDLRAALRALGEITGEVATDDLYDRIFSTFCIGK